MPASQAHGGTVYSVPGFLDLASQLEITSAEESTGAAAGPGLGGGRSPVLCAVLGRPVGHSLSPVIQLGAASALPHPRDFHYVRVEAGEEVELRRLLEESPACVQGFSVTMPGKPHALAVTDEVSARAAAIGSANTLVALHSAGDPGDGRGITRWRADNTDVMGVSACLDAVLSGQQPTHAVVVGNGGTARPAVAALATRGVRHVEVVARSERALALQGLIENCGMEFSWTRLDSPNLGRVCAAAHVLISTVPESAAGERAAELARANAVIDVIYDPYPTRLLTTARARGCPSADGLLMLAGQGADQFRQFTGVTASVTEMYTALRAHLGLGAPG